MAGKDFGGLDFSEIFKDLNQLANQVTKSAENVEQAAEDAGERVGESFSDGVERGLEDAVSKISASSLKINKAFKDLAKKITNQSITLSGLNIDFSDININSADFQKKIDEVFEQFKINNVIEFDSKASEKQFKNMLGLHAKYAIKLSKLQEQKPKLTSQASIKANAQEQLAIIDGLKEIQKILNQTSGMSTELPHVYFGDVKELRTSIDLIEQLEKGEEKIGKQRDTNAEKIRKENKELKERNKILEEKVGPIGEGELPPARKPRGRKPKVEVPVATGTDDSALRQLRRDAEAASKAFEDAHDKLSDIIKAEQELDWQLTSRGFVDYGKKYQDTATIKKQELDNLTRSFTKKSDHKSNVAAIEGVIRNLINNEALSPLGVFSDPKDLSEFVDYKFAVEDGKTNKELNSLLNSLINKLQREVFETMDTYKSWGDIQSRDNPEADLLIQERRRLAKEHEVATEAYNNEANTSKNQQTKFDLVEAELRVEKEITAEIEKQAIAQKDSYMAMSRDDATGYISDHYDHDVWDKWYSKSLDPFRTQIAETLEADIKMRNAALNQMWDEYKHLTGQDIGFDEFLNKKIPLYRGETLDSQSQSEKALSFSLTPQTAEEFGERVLEIWLRPIDTLGMANPTYIHQPEAEVMVSKDMVPEYGKWRESLVTQPPKKTSVEGARTYETDSGQMSMLPAVEEEIKAKDKLAKTNDKVAESQKKIKEAAKGTQMTIDDIVPASAEGITPKVDEEAKALDKVGKAADKASDSKKKFAKANKEVAASVTPSVEGLETETDAMDEVGEKAKTAWSMTRPGVKTNSLAHTSDELENFNLPLDYMGERGQDAVQIFAKLKSEIEEMTGKPVIIDFVSDVNDEGQLEAVGATLKYVNEEAGVTVKQFYEIQRNQDGVLVATQSHEKATLAAAKAAKVFNTEMQQKLALEQIKTLEGQMGSLELDLTEVKNAANAINDKASLENFNLALRSAKEQAKQLKTELKGQNTLDTIASMERALLTLPSRLDEVKRRLSALGDIDGVDVIDDVLRSINDEYQRFLTSDDSEEKVKLFRDLTSSMVWANAELRNLGGKNTEKQRQTSTAKKEDDAQKKADRESYAAWWKTTIDAQDEVDNYEKILLEREQQEKAKDERVVAARKKKEEEYNAWWQKALFDKERAPNLKYGKTTANSARRKFDATEGAVDALGVTNPEILAKLDAYKEKVAEVERLRERFASDHNAAEDAGLVKQFQKAAYEAENVRRGIKAVIDEEQKMVQLSAEQGFDPVELTAGQLSNLENEMIAHAKATAQGRMEIKGWNDDHTKMYYTVTDSKGAVHEMTEALGQGTNRLYQYRTATKETGTLMQQIFKGIKTKAKELLSFVIGGGGVYKVIELLRQGIQYVREIDLALTELKKVTDETEETYDKFLETAAKTGARLGSTIAAVTEATATFAKLGYTMEQATEMAEAAIVYKNVGDNIASTEDAADSIISTMKGFKLEATESMKIVDRFNEVGNRFAITSRGIGEALRLSASALSEGGNSLDESIGLITAANEVVNDPSSVGTALKTLTLRLRGSKTELEEMGEDVTDMATTTSQLQAKLLALTGGKVDIMLDANTFKNSTQILREMAEAWEDMNDIQRASALELMGGKRQANVLSALIQNFDTVEKVIETSANSAGSALKENERYLDSIQGKIDQFNNAMQAMWSNTLDSDWVKGFVALGTEIIKIIDKIGLLNSLLLAFGASKLIPWILTAATGMGTFGESLKYVGLMMTSVNGTGAALIPTIVAQTKALWAGSAGANIFGLSLKTVGIALKALMSTPLGWFLAIGAAIFAIVKIVDAVVVTTEELTEELNEFKSELQDIQSELESVNSELETTNDRMAELLAKDTLSFTEKEELDNLRKQNDELQRRLDLLDSERKLKQGEAAKTFTNLMDQSINEDTYNTGGKRGFWDRLADALDTEHKSTKWSGDEYFDYLIEEYEKELQKQKDQEGREINRWTETKANPEKYSEKIGEQLRVWTDAADGLDYGINKETDEWLDYVYNLQDKWAIASGGNNAKTNAITRIFNKDDNAEISSSIDGYVEALRKGDTSAKSSIENIINNNKALVEDLEASGLSVGEAVDYFTSFASELEFATLDGKIKEVSQAAANFENLIKGGAFKVDGVDTGLVDLFDEEGKIIQTKLSQVFQGTSEQTREDITRLLEGSYDQIKNGTVDVERLLSGFALKTTQQILEIQNKVLGDQNLELFPNLKEEINGIIDKFSEFSAAVGSVVDALDTLEQARAEEAYSGSISIETLENLMKYTDDYAQLVEIDETGAIRLSTDAEKILIEQRIEKIKTDAAAAVQTAQTNLEQAKYNAKAVNETGPVQEALTSATDALAGAWAYLGSIIGDITDGNFSGMFERASTAYGKVTAGREEKRTQVNVSVEDAEEALANALNQQKIANALTSDNIKSKYSSEEASGGNKTEDEVEDDAFQKEMDYWENRIGANQARYEQLQNEIDLLEAKGQKADASFYEEQIQLEGQRLTLLEGQKAAALEYLGTLEEGSEEWWEVANVLNGLESDIDDVTASIVDLQDAIGEIDAYKFEEFNTRLDNLTSKLGTIRDLIAPNGEEDWFDDEGQWTEEGVAVLGAHIQELEFDKEGLKKAQEELDKYDLSYGGNEAYYEALGIHSEQEYYDKVEELTEQQYQYLESINDTEQSIVDMYESNIDAVEEYTETLIDSYNDYIDSVKEALQAERDLYDFKKNVQKQSKDIAAIERRITSLSGSTNASDIAERRRLEADLYGAREELDDTYYDHAKTTQQEALDNEAAAYEETMTRFIDGLRLGLDQATTNMDEFLMSVTSMVTLNADTVLTKYQETELPLGDAITNPWEAAKKAVGNYSGDALDLMNKWTQGGFFTTFPETVKGSLTSPWSAGSTAAGAFKTSVSTVMSNVVSNISTNVKTASGELAKLYQQIKDTEKRAAEAKVVVANSNPTPSPSPSPSPAPTPEPMVKLRGLMKTSREMILGSKSFVDENTETINGTKYYRDSKTGYYYKISDLNSKRKYDGGRTTGWAIPKGTWFYTKHAKGTTGTTRDEWAITDEPQFGDELVLVPGKDGNLSFMRKGTGIVPADMTQKLLELAQIPTSDLMNKNMTAIVPNITKNDFKNEFNFESLVHVDKVDSDTLPKLEKMVDKKIDDFSKALNYSLKRFAR